MALRDSMRAICCALLLGPCPTAAWSQAADGNAIHWAYSTFFGTGWYQIGDNRDAFAIRYAPKKTITEATIDPEGRRTVGIEWRFPVTFGLDHFPLDDVAGTVDLRNLANLSVTPGLYLEIPVKDRWSLRPFAAAGWGTVLDGGESAWTYWAGIKSRWLIHGGDVQTAVVNSAGYVGYSPNNGPSSGFWPIMTAIELRHPVAELATDELRLNWHLSYTFFQNDLEVLQPDAVTDPISDQWELAAAFSRRDAPITIGWFEFDRLGLAYRFSSDGDLKGIGVVFASLFDQ